MKNKKNILRSAFSFLIHCPMKYLKSKVVARIHTKLHNENTLFYTLSPNLLIGIVKALNIQNKNGFLKRGFGYYEFGLFKGFSFWYAEKMSREYAEADMRFYGFDSFEGLPVSNVDIDRVHWNPGNYAASEEFVINKLKENGSDMSRIKLFKGFFSKQLFARLKQKERFLPISICLIDSDMYESCVDVLGFVKDYLVVGSIIMFDDYNVFEGDANHGERKAFSEFQKASPGLQVEHLFDFGWHGVAFRVKSLQNALE